MKTPKWTQDLLAKKPLSSYLLTTFIGCIEAKNSGGNRAAKREKVPKTRQKWGFSAKNDDENL